MSTVTLKLTVNSVEYDFSHAVRSYQKLNRACNEEFRHALSTRTVILQYSPQLLTLVTADSTLVVVKIDGIQDFTGRIAPSSIRVQSQGASLSNEPDVEDIQVELEKDYTYKLDKAIKSEDSLVLENAFVCNPLYPAQSIIHHLLSLANVQSNISDTIDTILMGFSVDSGTVGEALDTLLYEYGYTYRFDPYGKVVLVKYLYDSPEPMHVLTDEQIQTPLEIEKLAKEAEAVEVSYYPLKNKAEALLYMADLPFSDNGLRSGWPIQPGFLWPEEANVQEAWFEYDDKALAQRINERGEVEVNKEFTSIVLTKNHTIEEKFEYGIQREVEIFQNKRARLAYRNTSAVSKLIYYCNIHGDVIYRAAQVVLKYNLAVNPISVDRYDALYIHDNDTAAKLLGFRTERLKSAGWRYKFKLDTEIPVGTVIQLLDPYAGINALALLIEQAVDIETGIHEYRAVGLAAPLIGEPSAQAKILQSPPSAPDSELAKLYSARILLSSEGCSLITDWQGVVESLETANTTISVWIGDKEDTGNWNIIAIPSSGISGLLIENTFYVMEVNTDAGYVNFIATHKNISLLSEFYTQWGQRVFGSFRFARAPQLTKRYFISKSAPLESNPLTEYLPANYEFIERLFSKYIKLQSGGSIRGGDRYDADGSDTGQSVSGFWQGANGKLKIANGEIDIKDILNRRIKISTQDGLKALDSQDKIIHDIPDQAIAPGEYYMGHLVWWQDPGVTLLNAEITSAQIWYTVNIAKRSYTNIKGVILDIYASYNPSDAVAWGNTRVAFRPYGSALEAFDCFTPYVSMNLTGNYVDYLRSSMMLLLPIGQNGGNLSFQFWPNQVLGVLYIGQRGILV